MQRRLMGILMLAGLTAAPTLAWGGPGSVQPATDRTTGVTVTITPGAPGTATFEVRDGQTTIRKAVGVGRSITTITAGRDREVLTIDRAGLTVEAEARQARVALAAPEGVGPVVALLAESPATEAGLRLLARLHTEPGSAAAQAFTFTQALLESAVGDRTATLEVVNWTRPEARPRAVQAAWDSGPGDCWNQYVTEAVRTASDYVDCYNNTNWYDLLGRLGCSAIYNIEAEGAWIWYLNCVGSGAL